MSVIAQDAAFASSYWTTRLQGKTRFSVEEYSMYQGLGKWTGDDYVRAKFNPQDYGVDEEKLKSVIIATLQELHLGTLATKDRFLSKTHLNLISQFIRGEYLRPEVKEVGRRIIESRGTTLAVIGKYLQNPTWRYLPVFESYLNPDAKSPAGAAGVWQLMPDTAEAYNLKVDSPDERKSTLKSTKAANEYLQDLKYGNYSATKDSWAFTLAGYNAGPVKLLRIRKKCGWDLDYWQLRATKGCLPQETREYLHRLLAAAYVVNYVTTADLGKALPD